MRRRKELAEYLRGETSLEANPEGQDEKLFCEAMEDLEPLHSRFLELDQIEEASDHDA